MVTVTVNGTDVGARHTSLLQPWYSTVPRSTCSPFSAVAPAVSGTWTSVVPSNTHISVSSNANFCLCGGGYTGLPAETPKPPRIFTVVGML